MDKCPRQDPNNFKTGDIFEVPCTSCGTIMEFFKDEARRKCKSCGVVVANPKYDPDAK